MSIPEIEKYVDYRCDCGKIHTFSTEVIVGEGAVNKLSDAVKKFSAKKVYLVADKNTYAVAGENAEKILSGNGIKVEKYVYNAERVIPDETSVGAAIMHYTSDCDVIVGVGSGVINDICKIVANVSGKPYIIVGTAPSMDGYASASSSMERAGLKISLNSKAPEVIIGDLDILCNAPIKMMVSGMGDMLAKYVSICEWRIANIITGEYYCEEIAELVRVALKKCTDNAQGLLKRDKEAVKAVFEGLIITGAAMEYAGVSRPASGAEHYISHVLDMRGLSFKTPTEFHGIQCAIGTLSCIKIYEMLKTKTPDRQKALSAVSDFDYSAWCAHLREFLGHGAESMIALEAKEGKYDKATHPERLELILKNWNRIIKIIDDELPPFDEVNEMWKSISDIVTFEDFGVENSLFGKVFETTRDIRDKYILSRLVWDLGLTDEILKDFNF